MKFDINNIDEILDAGDTMHEASYKYNIGFQEMVEFYQKATKSEIKQMEALIKRDSWVGFKKLIKKVLGIELKG